MMAQIQSWPIFFATTALALAATVLAWRRLSRKVTFLLALALLCWTLAAGGLQLRWASDVVVMVDTSASTRGAAYHDEAFLRRRMGELLGRRSYWLARFDSEYQPPTADAVVLFSDGRINVANNAPPTWVAVDPLLEKPADAAVASLAIEEEQIAVAVRNSGLPRRLHLEPGGIIEIPTGQRMLRRPLPAGATSVRARFDGDDVWPENDQLVAHAPPPAKLERWWVGPGAPSGWQTVALPMDSAACLAASVIVINDTQADPAVLDAYVRALGGGVIFVGPIQHTLSPLSFYPPQPQTHWVILVDASGSMNQPAAGTTRFSIAARAAAGALVILPPDDLVSVGGFSDAVRWWSQGRSVRDTAKRVLPPASVVAHGATNLETALETIIGQADASPRRLLILTDAEATIENADRLKTQLTGSNVRLHVLLVGEGRAAVTLRQLADATGGGVIVGHRPEQWVAAFRSLARAAARPAIRTDTIVRQSEYLALPTRTFPSWYRAWIKDGAQTLAWGEADSERVPLAGRWQVGAGRTVALAHSAVPPEIETLAEEIARPPRDPRFAVTWEEGGELVVQVDAKENGRYVNDLRFTLELGATSRVMEQIAPGLYRAALAAAREPAHAVLRLGERVLDARAVAGRYEREFDEVGNDREAMRRLARLGGVVEPDDHRPLQLPRGRTISLQSPLAALGATLIFVAVALNRRRAG